MAHPLNAPKGPKNQRPAHVRPEQTEAWHNNGTDNRTQQRQLNAQRIQQQQRFAMTRQSSNCHSAYSTLQARPAYHPQITNAASQLATSNTYTANNNQLWNYQAANSSEQCSIASTQRSNSTAVSSSPSKPLNPAIPSWSPETTNVVPASPGHSQQILTPASCSKVCSAKARKDKTDVLAKQNSKDATSHQEVTVLLKHSVADTGLSQVKRASDEPKVPEGSTAAHTVQSTNSAPAVTQNFQAIFESHEQDIAEMLCRHDPIADTEIAQVAGKEEGDREAMNLGSAILDGEPFAAPRDHPIFGAGQGIYSSYPSGLVPILLLSATSATE